MTPLEIRKENQRREREEARRQRGRLPDRKPVPENAKAEIQRIKVELAARKKP